MVKWYEECYRLLCEAEHLITGIPLAGRERVPEAFLRYGYEEESLSHTAGHPCGLGIHATSAVKS